MKTLISRLGKQCLLVVTGMTLAQLAFGQDDQPRLSFWRTGAFYETGKSRTDDAGTSSLGHTAGIEISVNPVYDGVDGGDEFVLGWSANGTFGFNFSGTRLRPVSLDIGFWGGYMINDDLEVGLQYCFLGVYGYQSSQFFGSKLSPAVKFRNFQVTLSRAGDGAIRGCFVPRFDGDPYHAIEVAYYLKKFIVGARLQHYRFGATTTDEYRAFIALNYGE